MRFNFQKSRVPLLSGILYSLFLTVTLFLLVSSRTGEAKTIWQVLHPALIPTLLIATFLLSVNLLSSGKTAYKLAIVICHSIVIHSFFAIIFPAGDLSGQQMILGQTRRVFDNTISHGLSGWPSRTIGIFIVEALGGINLQAALSTILARMLSTDIFYVHLFLVPVLWGIFMPIGSFLLTRAIGGSEKASVLASLLVSAFPFSTYFGAISVPNSLGFIFFLFSLYFMVKYLSSNDSKAGYLMLFFCLFSFLAHFLTGFMSISFLLLTIAFKAYKSEKRPPTLSSKALVVVVFATCLCLLPLAFVYLRLFGSPTYVTFTLDHLGELPLEEIVGLFFLGELTYGFDTQTIVLMILGPALAFVYAAYLIFKSKTNADATLRPQILFLFLAFLMTLIEYRILKLFMEGLPINEERLWVIRDLTAAPFVALAIAGIASKLKAIGTTSLRMGLDSGLNRISKGHRLRALSLALTLSIIMPAVLGGWVTFSLEAAYPRFAPLQTTWYELEAVRYIEENTDERYVVVGDIWTIYAGEVIVGIKNPNAYYFGESSKLGYDLFLNMSEDPSPRWMLFAMNYTQTTRAYFVVTESRLRIEDEFNSIIARVQETSLTVFYISQNKELYVYSYSNATSP